jgi:arylsulfatase A-like enzyme
MKSDMNFKNINILRIAGLVLLGLATLPCYSQKNQSKSDKPNILFIAIDDLKPILGCYGDKQIKTPNIDRLAAMGTVFMQNYCQQAVCGPTRASIMTGMRPDHTGVWDLKTRMRDVNPDILSLPQYLISQGYSTQGIGKVYDTRCVDKQMDAPSWSVPYYNYFKTELKYYSQATGFPDLGQYQLPKTKELVEKYTKEAQDKGIAKGEIDAYVSKLVKPSVECANVPDNAYNDGANVLRAKEILVKLKTENKPFFFAVGFSKPHLPFVAPQKYWDLYKRDEMPVAEYQEKSKNGPDIAYHNAGELRAYSDIPALIEFTDQKDFGLTLPLDKQKELMHGYYAAVSYTDAQVGILLNTLDSLGLTENTIIVLWGDHGWHLGDHNLWCKHTNFEQATRSPLIISSPGLKPCVSSSPSEFVDVFPTLCDLAGVPVPVHLDGKSQVPVMKKPNKKVKEFSVSQYPRSGSNSETERLGYAVGKCMGYSIRTSRYRYTLWLKEDFRSTQAFNKDLVIATELYDYQKDPNETVNVADDLSYASVTKDMNKKILDFFASQVKINK